MKATNPWITYRTRFLIKAKQLNSSLAFTDSLGRHHSGRKGDYLVESSDGVLRIAPRQIFEDIYVPLMVSQGENPEAAPETPEPAQSSSPLIALPQSLRKRAASAMISIPPHLARKSPQPCRDRSSPSPSLRSF
jgi:hypothetical protein